MAEVVLFHHSQGLTPGVLAFADALRVAGHTVHTPDLYEGRTFATLQEAMAYVEEIGFGTFVERGVRMAGGFPPDVVYAGISLGVLPAQKLAQTQAQARGALLVDACIPVEEFGEGKGWPAAVPVRIHAKEADPLVAEDLDAARALVAGAADAELHLYPGDQHLFLDSSLPSYDPEAAALVTARAIEFLASC
ncbi:dienelactone hydrolase [Streptomyces spiroverticillatus]|uniref:Dienelactone hydrolase n=1 Tax=Streptomyces finlayi TaxID=67296 RepID=A0A918WT49_9ACTN|nr:dienelactone hydrolase family protein [Streptomyces finlayi]GGZ89798.1 dienelactone hydrolase [Streptomyces spiroverticillatus]GHC80611.1 dienelactone hydrolase [Streptomyces finlayi]